MKKLKMFVLLTFYLFSIISCSTTKNYTVSEKGNVIIRKVKNSNGHSGGVLNLTLYDFENPKDTFEHCCFTVNGIS
jgi:hypothetical protein